MKILKTKKSYAYIAFTSLKRVPPKDFPTIDDMSAVVDGVLPALLKATEDFYVFRKRSQDVSARYNGGLIAEPEANKELEAVQKDARKYEVEHKDDMVTVEF